MGTPCRRPWLQACADRPGFEDSPASICPENVCSSQGMNQGPTRMWLYLTYLHTLQGLWTAHYHDVDTQEKLAKTGTHAPTPTFNRTPCIHLFMSAGVRDVREQVTCVGVYLHTHKHTRTHTHTRTYRYTLFLTHKHTHTRACARTYTHTYTHTYIYKHKRTHTHTCTHS